MKREDKRAALMEKLTAIMREEAKLDEESARALGEVVSIALMKQEGGRTMYVPAWTGFERRESIRRDFNGRNREELMVQWGVSRSTIYRIIR